MFFKAAKATLGVLVILAASVLGYNKITADPDLENRPAITQITLEQRASHMVSYLDEDGKETTLCTATAIGPHALLTASHCNDGIRRKASTEIKLDYSAHHYTIFAIASDDRDHDIYLIDGPPLLAYISLKVGVAKYGESIRFYGFGEGVYPSTERDGWVRADDDPSDVDHGVQFSLFEIASYHGDSGSAVYNEQGQVVGIVSYGIVWYGSEKMGSYALAFSDEKIQIAQHFDIGIYATYPH